MFNLNAEIVANIISGFALLLSIYGIYHSRSVEKKQISNNETQAKKNQLFELENKLDFIISNCQSYDYFLGYKVKNFQDDLILFCKQNNVDTNIALRFFAKIYLPISNDGEDMEISMVDISSNATSLLRFLKGSDS